MAPTSPMTPLQAVAHNNADSLARTQDLILSEVWEINRWMLASLLAINSAAAASVYAAASVAYQTKIAACWFFIYGALAALGSGFILTFVLRAMDRPVSQAQLYWATVSASGSQSADDQQKHESAIRSVHRWSSLPQCFLFASVALFLLGIGKL